MPKSNYAFKGDAIAAADAMAAGSPATSQDSKYIVQLNAITPLVAPGPPRSLSASAGNGQVSLSWTAPSSAGSSGVTGYLVTTAGSDNSESTTAVGGTSATISGLTNDTAYTFVVVAVNDSAGAGTPASVSATPQSATVPGAPTGLSATAGNAQVSLSWSAPSSNGGANITGYAITYSGGTINTGSTSTSYAVTGLTNGTSYSFTVAAINSVGTGTDSSSASATPLTVPGAPTSLSAAAGNAQVELSWTAPSSNGGSTITGYAITYSGGTINTGSTSPSYTVTGLTNGTAYSFTVAATNSAGTGAASSSASATPATVPGAPTSLAATSGADSAVPLTWTAPSSNGGASITGYVVEWTPSGGSASTVSTGSASTSYTKTGLTNGTTYTFRVAAVNSVGQGAWSSSVTGTPVSPGPTFTNVSTSGIRNVATGSGTNSLALNFSFASGDSGTPYVNFTTTGDAIFTVDDVRFANTYVYSGCSLISSTNPGGWLQDGANYFIPLGWSTNIPQSGYASTAYPKPSRFLLPAGNYKFAWDFFNTGGAITTAANFGVISDANAVGKTFVRVSNSGAELGRGLGTSVAYFNGSSDIYWSPSSTATTLQFDIPSGVTVELRSYAASNSTLYPTWSYDDKHGYWSKTGLTNTSLQVPFAATKNRATMFLSNSTKTVTVTLVS